MSRSGFNIGQCQSTPLSELLESGIRVIDIRARNSFNRFSLWHENARLVNVDEYDEGHIWYEYGRDVLSPVIAFLTAHPSETVLIRLKRELGDEESTRTLRRPLSGIAPTGASSGSGSPPAPTRHWGRYAGRSSSSMTSPALTYMACAGVMLIFKMTITWTRTGSFMTNG